MPWPARSSLFAMAVIAAACLSLPGPALAAPVTPEIRTSAANKVPACVTPDRLIAFLKTRNSNLNPRFKDIARWYKYYGEAWRVRWDYAFFQMAIETNFLTYRAPNGRMGDVDPAQNNFAGIGTTGGGVPGDRYPDVRTGVLAQIQHLVAYSGERLADPVAPRTQLKQNDIVEQSRRLARPVHFADLSRRWAVDKNYGRSIEWVADQYRQGFCGPGQKAPVQEQVASNETLPWQTAENGSPPKSGTKPAKPSQLKIANAAKKVNHPAVAPKPVAAKRPGTPFTTVWNRDRAGPARDKQRSQLVETAAAATPAPPQPDAITNALAQHDAIQSGATDPVEPAAIVALQPSLDKAQSPPSQLGAPAGACSISTATFGGRKTVLIRLASAALTQLTALTVLDGFEKSMTDSFIKNRLPGGEPIGEFADRDTALAKAREICPAS